VHVLFRVEKLTGHLVLDLIVLDADARHLAHLLQLCYAFVEGLEEAGPLVLGLPLQLGEQVLPVFAKNLLWIVLQVFFDPLENCGHGNGINFDVFILLGLSIGAVLIETLTGTGEIASKIRCLLVASFHILLFQIFHK
jgi:hypothetical protein